MPTSFQQGAGLIHYYNRHKFHFLGITWHEQIGRCLTILSCPGDWPEGNLSFPLRQDIALPASGPVSLRASVRGQALQCSYRAQGMAEFSKIGPILDAAVISDEGGRGEHASFTGAFIGMAAFDITGSAICADYKYFIYEPVTGSAIT